ncbi:MAG TPA: Smr/MutS family protein, partial [Pyrinomonadaceae bacterium]|nr:Smr/MutS family protein [Pyrinomonadaceae bacterium]
CQGNGPREETGRKCFEEGGRPTAMRLTELFRGWLKRRAEDSRGRRREAAEPDPSEAEDEDALDPFDPFPEPVVVPLTDVLDLHTVAPREVKRLVESYLEDAREAGFRAVRIIHGKGVGVQRETVRKILARTPFVEHFADAPPEAGGWGATVVRFSETMK